MEAQYIIGSDGSKQSFIISLDSFDLNFLPKLSSWSKDDTVPLWSAPSSSAGVEYCEFEVLAGDGDSGNELYDNVKTQHCYVCDVEVPEAYWSEHVSSARHKTCSAIITASFERANKQMSVVPKTRAPCEGTYYCSICSTTVISTKRSTHENSQQHSQSALYECMLESLMKLYTDRNNLPQVREEIYAIICDPKVQKLDNENKVDSEIQANSEDIKPESNAMMITEDEKVLIETESGGKLLVKYDNYHGFYPTGNKTQCRVCRILIDSKFEHVKDIEHKKKTDGTKLKDKNCIRQLNHLLNHCILCNEIIENPEAHIVCSDTHNTLLNEALLKHDHDIKEKITANFIEDVYFNKDLYYCKICQIYFSKTDLIEHITNQAHINNMETLSATKKKYLKQKYIQSGYCSVCEIYIGQDKKPEKRHLHSKEHRHKVWLSQKDNLIHHHMTKTNEINQVLCKICDIDLNFDNINEHLNSDRHLTRYQKLLQDNYMKKSNDISVFCSLCYETELVIDEIKHIKQKGHKNHMNRLNHIMEVKLSTKGNIQNKELEMKELALEHHIEKHNEKYYHCKTCYSYFTEDSILNHITSKKHRQNFKQIQKSQASIVYNKDQEMSKNETASLAESNETNYKPQDVIVAKPNDNQSVEAGPVHDNIIPRRIHYLFELVNKERDVIQCVICNIEMDWGNMNMHRKGNRHCKLYLDLLKSNTMLRVRRKTFCECCREIVKHKCEYIHANSPVHRNNLIRNTKRLDVVAVKALSLKMFHESLEDDRRENMKVIKEVIASNDSDKETCDYIKTFTIQNSTITYEPKNSDEKASFADRKDSFISARATSNVTLGNNRSPAKNELDNTKDVLKKGALSINEVPSTSKAGNGMHIKNSIHSANTDSSVKSASKTFCEYKVCKKNIEDSEHYKSENHRNTLITNLAIAIKQDSDVRVSDISNFNTVTNQSQVSAIREDNDGRVSGIKETANAETNSDKLNTTYNAPNCSDPNRSSNNNNIKTETERKADDKDTGFYVCNVCERVIENNPTDIKSHLYGFQHKNKVAEKRLKEKEGVIPKTESYICDLCNIVVPKNAFDIKKHTDSALHAKSYENLLLRNKITIRDDKICYCEVCDLYFSKTSMSTHIEKAKHKSFIT